MKIQRQIPKRVFNRFRMMFGSALVMIAFSYLANNFAGDFAAELGGEGFSSLYVNADGVMMEDSPSEYTAAVANKTLNDIKAETNVGPFVVFKTNGYVTVGAEEKICKR